MKKVVSLFLTIIMVLGILTSVPITVNAISITDNIITIARNQKGGYGSDINKFTTWFYKQEQSAAWCAIFVCWCADQVGILDVAIPKIANCNSMMSWYKNRNEYYSVNSSYTPQKGDIIFFDSNSDGVPNHVEFVAENGFITDGSTKKVKCIGGNTTDSVTGANDYVAEKNRNINLSSFKVLGYAHPAYPSNTQTYTPPQIVKSTSTVDLKLGGTKEASVDVSFENGTYPNACSLEWTINNPAIAITNGIVVTASTYGSATIDITAIGEGTTSLNVYIVDEVTGSIITTDYITVNVSAKTYNILYNANGGSGTMSSSTVNYLSEFSLKPNTFSKIGYTFVGWNAYRNSDGKWFVEGPGWQTDEEIASNSYTKKLYQDSVAMTFNDSWFAQLDSINATDTFTFYAVWQPNHICVYMGTVTKPATCTENGIETFICSCGDSYTQEISATGHSYSSEWIVDVEPTCTEEGSKSKTCSVCQSVTTETTEPLGHDYSTDWIIDKTASCTETGSKSHHCSRCESTIDITVIEATGHTESDWILDEEATNSTICSQHKECIICGEIVETQIIEVSHTVSSWQTTKEATVYSAGEKVGECTGCGATVKEEIPQLKCSKPTLETVRNATNGVRIVWSKVKGGDSYNIYRRTKSGSYRLIGTTEKSYFDDESAVSGKRYYYSVKAVNEAGESAYSSADSIYHLATPTLTKICNATGGLKITWSKVSGAEGYYIYRKLYGAEEWTKIATIKDSSTVSYKDTKVSEGKVYVYTVKAFDGKRKSSIDSDGIWLRYLKKPTLKTISNTGNGVKITWDEITRAEKYNVYRRVSNSEYKYIGSTSNTYYTDKTAKSGKKYYYTIRAQKGETVSYISNTLSKYYLEDPTLNTPSSTKSGVKLSWSEVTGAQGYIIYRKTGSGSYTKLKTEKGVTNLSYIDSSAKKGTKYTYKVKAYYSKTYSAYSNTKAITDKY